ncbi:hypothetical protein NDU88_005624 [Pleurodeles waltl]|uniref:Uncharacterized protein n=1 Tax=Pleurodeles waltl TaxID=8319 RepID=A0AAV7W8D3_PLEWA|nr:hypothetical protein NDU88_005624 [Pleurodeles waltl]
MSLQPSLTLHVPGPELLRSFHGSYGTTGKVTLVLSQMPPQDMQSPVGRESSLTRDHHANKAPVTLSNPDAGGGNPHTSWALTRNKRNVVVSGGPPGSSLCPGEGLLSLARPPLLLRDPIGAAGSSVPRPGPSAFSQLHTPDSYGRPHLANEAPGSQAHQCAPSSGF